MLGSLVLFKISTSELLNKAMKNTDDLSNVGWMYMLLIESWKKEQEKKDKKKRKLKEQEKQNAMNQSSKNDDVNIANESKEQEQKDNDKKDKDEDKIAERNHLYKRIFQVSTAMESV